MSDKKKRIEMAWRGYRTILPPNAGPVQINETRQAFYAGAISLYQIMMHALDKEDDDPTADDSEDIALLRDIDHELKEFGEQKMNIKIH